MQSLKAKKRQSLNFKSPSLPMLLKNGQNRPQNSKSFLLDVTPAQHVKSKQSKSERVSEDNQKLPQIPVTNLITVHPFRHLIFSPVINEMQFQEHLKVIQQGLQYSKLHLKKVSDSLIKSMRVRIPQYKSRAVNSYYIQQVSKQKALFLDLDETLIHCCTYYEQPDFIVQSAEIGDIPIKVRPYCLEFLKQLSCYYDVYIFTASSGTYATAVTNFLDQDQKYIKGVFNRDYCIESKEGLYLKNLRIFQNYKLKDMFILDNLAHSFGYHILNGIPILEWTQDKSDLELFYLIDYFKEASRFDDLRIYNKEKLHLEKLIDYEL